MCNNTAGRKLEQWINNDNNYWMYKGCKALNGKDKSNGDNQLQVRTGGSWELFEGQNSQIFHIANKIGQTFRYSLMMYELKRKIGDTVKVHIGDIISFEKLREIGDLKEITKFIRNKTYALDPSNDHN